MDRIRAQLARYGYTVNDQLLIVTPKGKVTGISVGHRNGSASMRMVDGDRLLWSGRDAGDFVKEFWFARQLPQGGGE